MIQPIDNRKLIREQLLREMRELTFGDFFSFEEGRFGFVQRVRGEQGRIGIMPPEETPAQLNLLEYAKRSYGHEDEHGFENFKNDYFHDEEQAWRYDRPPVEPYEAYEAFQRVLEIEDRLAANKDIPKETLQGAYKLKQLSHWLRGQAERYLDDQERQLVTGHDVKHNAEVSGNLIEEPTGRMGAEEVRGEYVGFLANAGFLEKAADFGIRACKSLSLSSRVSPADGGGFRGYRF